MAIAGLVIFSVWPVHSQAEEVSFKKEIVPLLKRQCVACHLTGQEQGEMALHPRAAYGTLVGVPSVETDLKRVEPGDPNASYLYLKLTNAHVAAGGYGEPMPMGSWPLDDADVEKIRAWIEQGAEDN